MATIKDVAREAGVSLGTVSNVLNGKVKVKQETRDRVYRAIKSLDFQYNMNASALRTKTTKNIGLVIPTIVNPYYPELVRGVEETLREEGFTLFLCSSDRDEQRERQYIEAFLSKGVDGLILVKSKLSDVELEQIVTRTPLVLVDYESEDSSKFCSVNVDDNLGIIQGMELLEQYGHEKIAFVSGIRDAYSSKCRIESYKECLIKRGIPFRSEFLIEGRFIWDGGYSATEQFLSLEDHPTAIFAANDLMAIGAIRAILDCGKRVPLDISVLGYDDIELARVSMLPLTTIHQPKERVGAGAVRLLLENMNKDTVVNRQVTMPTRVVFRESVGYAPV